MGLPYKSFPGEEMKFLLFFRSDAPLSIVSVPGYLNPIGDRHVCTMHGRGMMGQEITAPARVFHRVT